MPSSTASPSTAKPAPADAKLDHSTLSAPSSLADLDPDLLRQILGFAQPTEHHHRFEWSGLVGRTCRVFHSISREDSDVNGGVVVDLNLFQRYKSILTLRCRPRDVSANFLLVLLMNDDVARARIKEFHYNPGDLGKVPRRNKGRIVHQYAKRRHKKTKPLLSALKSLFQQPNSFPNLTCLDIYRPEREYAFDLMSCELFESLPLALPNIGHLCLGHCFDCSNIEPDDSSLKATITTFAEALQRPLCSLSLMGSPWMTDDCVNILLSTIGSNLEVLELIDCCMLHKKARYSDQPYIYEPFPMEDRTPLSHRSLKAVARHCTQLRYFRLVDVHYSGIIDQEKKNWTEMEAAWCNREMESIKSANPHLAGGVQNINYEALFGGEQKVFGIQKGTIYQNPDYMEWSETRFRGSFVVWRARFGRVATSPFFFIYFCLHEREEDLFTCRAAQL